MIAELERPHFDSGKPAFEAGAGEIKRILLAVSTRINGRGAWSCVPPRSARTGIAVCGRGASAGDSYVRSIDLLEVIGTTTKTKSART